LTVDELERAKEELDRYPGDEITVADAVPIISRITGVKIHLLQPEEVNRALQNAKKLIKSGEVKEGPLEVKYEVVKATEEKWTALSPGARAMVGTLWASEVNSDMVLTTVDDVQPKDKNLDLITNIRHQKLQLGLGSESS
jgi:hypothetical protein